MEVLLYALIAIGGIASFVGGLWFLVVAFRTSVVWGLACIFIPLVSLFFLIKYWSEAKLAFLTNLAGSVIMMVAVMGLAAYTTTSSVENFAQVTFEDEQAVGGDETTDDWWEDQAPVEATQAPVIEERYDEGLPEPEPAITLEDDVDLPPVTGVEPLFKEAEPEPEATQPPRRWRAWGVAVPIEELASRIGQRVEIHTSDGRAHKAELEAVGPESIKVKQRMGAGHVSYTIDLEKIVEVRGRE